MVVDDIPGKGRKAGSSKRKAGVSECYQLQRSTQLSMVHIPSKPPERCSTTVILMPFVSSCGVLPTEIQVLGYDNPTSYPRKLLGTGCRISLARSMNYCTGILGSR